VLSHHKHDLGKEPNIAGWQRVGFWLIAPHRCTMRWHCALYKFSYWAVISHAWAMSALSNLSICRIFPFLKVISLFDWHAVGTSIHVVNINYYDVWACNVLYLYRCQGRCHCERKVFRHVNVNRRMQPAQKYKSPSRQLRVCTTSHFYRKLYIEQYSDGYMGRMRGMHPSLASVNSRPTARLLRIFRTFMQMQKLQIKLTVRYTVKLPLNAGSRINAGLQ